MNKNQKLTYKQQAFIDYWLAHPKATGTDAALATYNTTDRVTAASISYENLRKPQIMAHLVGIGQLSEGVVLQVIREWGTSESPRKREIALKAAMWSHDKVVGRATTRVEQPPQLTRISINLAGDGSEPPADMR